MSETLITLVSKALSQYGVYEVLEKCTCDTDEALEAYKTAT